MEPGPSGLALAHRPGSWLRAGRRPGPDAARHGDNLLDADAHLARRGIAPAGASPPRLAHVRKKTATCRWKDRPSVEPAPPGAIISFAPGHRCYRMDCLSPGTICARSLGGRHLRASCFSRSGVASQLALRLLASPLHLAPRCRRRDAHWCCHFTWSTPRRRAQWDDLAGIGL
jgi:hypothetical protein